MYLVRSRSNTFIEQSTVICYQNVILLHCYLYMEKANLMYKKYRLLEKCNAIMIFLYCNSDTFFVEDDI